MLDDLQINGRVTIPAAELSWTAVRAAGPGGQNVNKVATKVDLRFDLPSSQVLRPATKERLRRLATTRLDADGRVVITSQATRTQRGNLEDARHKLAELIRLALMPPKPRQPTKPTKASQRRRLDAKRRLSDKKNQRGSRARVSLSDG